VGINNKTLLQPTRKGKFFEKQLELFAFLCYTSLADIKRSNLLRTYTIFAIYPYFGYE